jgi:hypothetical protein
MASHTPVPSPEKYFVAFVIQGEDVFKITADSILHTCGNSGEAAFQGIAKLRAAAAPGRTAQNGAGNGPRGHGHAGPHQPGAQGQCRTYRLSIEGRPHPRRHPLHRPAETGCIPCTQASCGPLLSLCPRHTFLIPNANGAGPPDCRQHRSYKLDRLPACLQDP